ncbi:hypothetical protein AB0M87_04720 [Streptomyces sp. NPDC051320]|uniref:hypothetical protein n=1 Tax=Streptomyces sp. NPDC051320 TaxID=3154644 RepID=UPI003439D38F
MRRLTVGPGQVWRALDAARHEVDGAKGYIGRLEKDNRELSREAESACGERDDFKAGLEKAALRIAELEGQLTAFDQLCTENTQLRAGIANARAVRQDPRVPPVDITEPPEAYGDFINDTATAWRAASLESGA